VHHRSRLARLAGHEDPAWPEIFVYTDAISYRPGEEVRFHASATAKSWSLRIDRDGLEPMLVHEVDDLPGRFTPAPKDAYKNGCGWPVLHTWRLPDDLKSGFYRVAVIVPEPAGVSLEDSVRSMKWSR